MEENIKALNELNKGATMGIEAINFIIDKVKDKNLVKLLKKELKEYKQISKRVEEIYNKYDKNDNPKEPNPMTKAMTWWGIEMKTFLDESDSKIAELLIKGTDMGIIEGNKIINNNELAKEIQDIAHDYIDMQEHSIEDLKEYL